MSEPNPTTDTDDATPEEECKACGYVMAAVGILIGVAFLYISFDVLSGGGLTRSLGLGTARSTEVP